MTSRARPILFSAAALLALVAGPAAAQDAGAGPAGDAAAADAADAALVAAATKDYERRLGKSLRVAQRGVFVVRGDHDQPDLDNIAEVCAATFDHYVQSMSCTADEVVKPAKKGERPHVEVFQFKQEKAYLDFLDKVFSRLRDDTVDDRRLALMRRQRGFFVVTPRPIVAQYMGPSDLATVRSQAVHKSSHVLLLSHRKAGAWMPWWFLEGVATWQEMAVLRESRTYCLEVERPGDYAAPGTPEADEAAKARLESAWRTKVRAMVAAKRHRDLSVLARLSLNELALEDVMQSWSVVDWLFRNRKLATLTAHYKDQREFAKTCELALEAPPAGVEERWKSWVLEAR